MNQEHGFILLLTLIMMLVLSALVLSLLQTQGLYWQVLYHWDKRQARRVSLEAVLIQLWSQNIPKECTIEEHDPNRVIEMLQNPNTYCLIHFRKRAYHYILSDMGPFPCLKIKIHDAEYSSHHWLITVSENHHHPMMAQVRYSTREHEMICPKNSALFEQHHEGILSWRFIF